MRVLGAVQPRIPCLFGARAGCGLPRAEPSLGNWSPLDWNRARPLPCLTLCDSYTGSAAEAAPGTITARDERQGSGMAAEPGASPGLSAPAAAFPLLARTWSRLPPPSRVPTVAPAAGPVAETITGSDERTGSEMPAEAEVRASAPALTPAPQSSLALVRCSFVRAAGCAVSRRSVSPGQDGAVRGLQHRAVVLWKFPPLRSRPQLPCWRQRLPRRTRRIQVVWLVWHCTPLFPRRRGSQRHR